MLRKRLIFSLIYDNGYFTQSRNFRLQRVGDLRWLEGNYQFQHISFSLDELIVVDASRDERTMTKFSQVVNQLAKNVFIPLVAGGGIKTVQDADMLFEVGADKVIINTGLLHNPTLVQEIARKYGTQCVVASVDYKLIDGIPYVYTDSGQENTGRPLAKYLEYVEGLGVGEVLLNSIDKDGTGFGYDIATVKAVAEKLTVPLVICGGAGNEYHLEEGLALPFVSGVATANLFNFIGDGLPNARQYLLQNQVNLANWKNQQIFENDQLDVVNG